MIVHVSCICRLDCMMLANSYLAELNTWQNYVFMHIATQVTILLARYASSAWSESHNRH